MTTVDRLVRIVYLRSVVKTPLALSQIITAFTRSHAQWALDHKDFSAWLSGPSGRAIVGDLQSKYPSESSGRFGRRRGRE